MLRDNDDTNAVGIHEYVQDIVGYKLLNTKFITNRLRYLYTELEYIEQPRLITDNTDWININNLEVLKTTFDSINNTAINL